MKRLNYFALLLVVLMAMPVSSLQAKNKKDKTAKVYKLVPDSGSNQTVNLWVESDTTVVILDDQMNTPAKPEHYRLKTVKNKK